MLRKTPLRPNPEAVRNWNRRSRRELPKTGPRTRERAKHNAELNKVGITWCEIRLPGCTQNMGLTWAHSRKSRFLTAPEHWLEAARACLTCHMKIEAMSH